MIKNKFKIIYGIICVIIASWWFYTYNYVAEYKMYHMKDGVADTSMVYDIVPKYIKKKVDKDGDKTVWFYNKQKKHIITIKEDSLNNYIIIK